MGQTTITEKSEKVNKGLSYMGYSMYLSESRPHEFVWYCSALDLQAPTLAKLESAIKKRNG